MPESGPTDGGVPGAGSAPAAQLDALREQGAAHFDPVRFRFIEALARRAAAQPEAARRLLEERLGRALTEYSERFAAGEAREQAAAGMPAADDPQSAARGGSGPLAELLAHIGRQSEQPPLPASPVAPLPVAAGTPAAPGELKSVAYFRSTWSQLSVEQQLAEAIAQVPDNAGPLNSHLLALRSLLAMQEAAPGYLRQFLSYLDALFWLDQAEAGRDPAAKAGAAGDGEKKRKPARRG